jgi:cytoskeletal protein CcmA (bactofilin family)
MPSANKKNTDGAPQSEGTADRPREWLGSSLHVKGDITATEDLLIEGWVDGLIQLEERSLTVGPMAKLTAEINARDVVVYGYVKGNVRAKGRIVIKKDGVVVGNLKTAYITIEDGAEFKGSLEIKRSAAKEAEEGSSSRAASARAASKSS